MEESLMTELDDTATRIQSVVRGRKARCEATVDSWGGMSDWVSVGRKRVEEKMEDLMEKELGTAATSLQAIFRGHQVQRQAPSGLGS